MDRDSSAGGEAFLTVSPSSCLDPEPLLWSRHGNPFVSLFLVADEPARGSRGGKKKLGADHRLFCFFLCFAPFLDKFLRNVE